MNTPWSNPTADIVARRDHFDVVYEYLLDAGVNPGLAGYIEQKIWEYHQKNPPLPKTVLGSEPLNADDFEGITQR